MSALALTNRSGGVLYRVDRFLSDLPKQYLMAAFFVAWLLIFYADFLSGPWIPFGVFYLLDVYFAAKYVGSRFSYVLAFIAVAGKTYVKVSAYPDDALWWQGWWQFASSISIYGLFCYLINAQLAGRRRAESALDEVSRLNQAIISNADSGILVFDAEGRCVSSNHAAARIFGCAADELRRYDFERGPQRARALLNACREVRCTGAARKFTTAVSSGSGREVWCVVSVSRITSSETSYTLMVLTDISAYKLAQEARKQADLAAARAMDRASAAERHLVNIAEETQQRLGQELHDDLGQHLTGVAFLSEVLCRKLQDEDRAEMCDAAQITAMVNEAMSKTRQLAHGLYPVELKERGLCAVLGKFATQVESMYRIDCEFVCDSRYQIADAEAAIHLYRIAQEAVNNAVKHGNAARIVMRGEVVDGMSQLVIVDDGSGIPEAPASGQGGGLGMRTMRYRADLIGASLDISTLPEGGTRVAVGLPYVC